MTSYTHKMANISSHRFCDVISLYAYITLAIYNCHNIVNLIEQTIKEVIQIHCAYSEITSSNAYLQHHLLTNCLPLLSIDECNIAIWRINIFQIFSICRHNKWSPHCTDCHVHKIFLPRLLTWKTCIWPSWCHCHSLSLASVKSR